MASSNKPVARVEAHLQKLREAGLDTQKFFEALVEIRDDSALAAAHREALHQVIAMESFFWYLEALNGEPFDRAKAAEAANEFAEVNMAERPEPEVPREEVTVKQRPPKPTKK